MKKSKIFTKLIAATTAPLAVLYTLPCITSCAKNNKQIFIKSNNVSSIPVRSDILFQNFDIRYLFSVECEQSKFEKNINRNYVLNFTFGLNMDYINAALYEQKIFHETSIKGFQFNSLEFIKEGFGFAGLKTLFQYIKTDSGEDAKDKLAKLFQKNIEDGICFCAPLMEKQYAKTRDLSLRDNYSDKLISNTPEYKEEDTGDRDRYTNTGLWNRDIYGNNTDNSYFIRTNRYSVKDENSFWPSSQNIYWIYENAKEVLGWDSQFKYENWENYFKTLNELKWKSIVKKYGIGKYPESKRALTWEIREVINKVLFQNIESLESGDSKINFNGSSISNLSTSFPGIETIPHYNFDILTFFNKGPEHSNNIRNELLTIKFNQYSDCQKFCKEANFKFELEPDVGINYFSPYFYDMFICFNQDKQLSSSSYILPHQLNSSTTGAKFFRSKDPYTGNRKANPIEYKATTVSPPSPVDYVTATNSQSETTTKILKFFAETSSEYKDIEKWNMRSLEVVEKKDETSAENSYSTPVVMHDKNEYCYIKPKYGLMHNPTEEEKKEETEEGGYKFKLRYNEQSIQNIIPNKDDRKFTPANFNTYLHTLPIGKVQQFFLTGKIDTTIYWDWDEEGCPEKEEGQTKQWIKYSMWGEISVKEIINAYNKEEKDLNQALSFMIDFDLSNAAGGVYPKEIPEGRKTLDDVINKSLAEKDGKQTCTISSSDSLEFNFNLIDYMVTPSKTFPYTTKSYSKFTTDFYFKKTINNFDGSSLKELYDNPELFKGMRLQYADSDQSVYATSLFKTSLNSNKIKQVDDPLLFDLSTQEYDKLTDQAKILTKLWPENPEHCGMEEPTTETSLKINYHQPNRMLQYKNDLALLYFLPTVMKKSTTYEQIDYTISPQPATSTILNNQGDTINFKYTFGNSFSTLETPIQAHVKFSWIEDDVIGNFDLTQNNINDIIKTEVKVSAPYETEVWEETKDFDIKYSEAEIRFTLKKEFLTINNFAFYIETDEIEQGYNQKTVTSVAQVLAVNNPIHDSGNAWSNSPTNCFRNNGDNVTTSLTTSDTFKEYKILLDNINFILNYKVDGVSQTPLKFRRVEAKSKETIPPWTYYYYELWDDDPELMSSKHYFDVVIAQAKFVETYSSPEDPEKTLSKTYWITKVTVTQKIDTTIYGQLQMNYGFDNMASKFNKFWDCGENQTPSPPVPPEPTPPTPEPTSWWTKNKIIGASIIAVSVFGFVLSLIAFKKHSKSNKK